LRCARLNLNGYQLLEERRFLQIVIILIGLIILPPQAWSDKFRIMPLGNSITAGREGSSPVGGYRDDLATMLLTNSIAFTMVGTQTDGVNVYPWHEGHAGWETRLLIKEITNFLNATHPDMVLIHTGTNDINPSPVSESAAYVQMRTGDLVDSIHNYDPNIVIFVASIIPRKGDLNAEHEALAPLLERMVKQKSEVGYLIFYCPVYEMFTEHGNWERMLFDDLHPTNDGYRVIANGFFKRLMDVLTAEGPIITDNFNRHDLVGYWTSRGDYELFDQKIRNKSPNTEGYIAVYRYEDDPKAVSVTFGANIDPAVNGNAGLALRLSDGTDKANGYAIIKESATSDLVLYHVRNGTLDHEIDRIAAISGPPAKNDTFKVALLASSTTNFFDCYINGRFDGRLTDPGKVEGLYGHQHAGVIAQGSQNNLLDNFTFYYDEQTPYAGPGGIAKASSANQETVVNSIAPEKLIVQIFGIDNAPVAGIPVAYRVTKGAGVAWTSTSSGLSGYEAEMSQLNGAFTMKSASNTAAGRYLQLPANVSPDQATAELQIQIEKAGTYWIWGRARGSDLNHNSFFISIDNQPEIIWQISSNNVWQWTAIGTGGAQAFSLSAGRHNIKIRGREADVGVDRFIFTTNAQFQPANTPLGSSHFSTDSQGRVAAQFIVPKTVGEIEVEAFVPDFPSLAERFQIKAVAGNPSKMVKKLGDTQFGKPNETLPEPFRVLVSDQFDNPIENTPVLFEVITGNGKLVQPQPVQTNAQGHAQTKYVLGPDAGTNRVKVTCPNHISDGVVFTATAEKVLFTIAGAIKYYTNDEPIPAVTLDVTGQMTASGTTNQQGKYALRSIPKFTDFSVTPAKNSPESTTRSVIDLYNAVLIMRYILGLDTLNIDQWYAADVDQSGMVTGFDAANIARFIVELPPANSNVQVGAWFFRPGQKSYSNIQFDLENQNFKGIMLGDVAGRWTKDQHLLSKSIYASTHYPVQWQTGVGDTIAVVFSVDRTDILSADLYYYFNPAEVEFIDIQKTPVSEKFSVFHNIIENKLQIAMFSPYYTTETGEFLKVRFRLRTESASAEAVVLEKYRINNEPFVILSAGVPFCLKNIHPTNFALHQNFPNPLSGGGATGTTIINYDIPRTSHVQLSIYNLLGQEICRLIDQELNPGRYQVRWDGTNIFGQPTASGIYIYRLKAGDQQISRRLLITK